MKSALTKYQEREVIKLAKQNNGSISSKDFKEILLSTLNNKKSTNNVGFNKNRYDFNFEFSIDKIANTEYKITLKGKHVSTNTFNGYASLGKRCAYKNSIKNAAYNYYMINKKKFSKIIPSKPFENATIQPIAYNPKSRDDDGCSVTLKTLRDMLVTYKLIKDDSRQYVKQLPTKEVISKDYKIELLVKSTA
jgi:hypothetical protein